MTHTSRFGIPLGDAVRCGVCERRCVLKPGAWGFCGNYVNVDGELVLGSYGWLSAVEVRPAEVKPFFHYWPGSRALTFSGWGCNFTCPWCQNWHLSKVRFGRGGRGRGSYFHPSELVRLALAEGVEGLCASFHEPGVILDYVLDVFEEGSRRGLYCCVVTNAFFTLDALRALLDAGCDGSSIDVKGCPETYARFMGARGGEEVVLRNAEYVLREGGHVEVVFLVVPGANDSRECIEWVLREVKERLGDDVPLHVNRYFPAYRYSEPPTPLETLAWVRERARELGFKYVYVGNVWGGEELINTYCPSCGALLIRRHHYGVSEVNLKVGGDGYACPECGFRVRLRGKVPTTYWRRA